LSFIFNEGLYCRSNHVVLITILIQNGKQVFQTMTTMNENAAQNDTMPADRAHPHGMPPARNSMGDADKWRALMHSAMDALLRSNFGRAHEQLLVARGFARKLLAEPTNDISDDDRVAALVVSQLNLANAGQVEEHRNLALNHLCSAYRTLTALINDQTTKLPLRQTALRHHRALVSAISQYRANDETQSDLDRLIDNNPLTWPANEAANH